MLDYLAYGGPTWLLLAFTAIVNFILIYLGFVAARYFEADSDPRTDAAFGIAQASIFGLTTLILAFSFSLTAERFDVRANLVVKEANAISTTYLRASSLHPLDAAHFRSLLKSYTELRLQASAFEPSSQARAETSKQTATVTDKLWDLAEVTADAHPGDVELGLLTQALNDTFDASDELTVAGSIHMPETVLALILIVTFASAFMLGLTFGRAGTRSISMAVTFSVLFAVVIFAIVDLDRPERGVVNISLAPLQAQLDFMNSHPTP